jgi:predicted O-methyltransferase YrrM
VKLPMVAQEEFKISPIAGYLSNPYLGWHETALLIGLVQSVNTKVMIEFGTQAGRTARAILQNVPTLERYLAIDVPPDHYPTLGGQRSEVPTEAGRYAKYDPRYELILRERGSFDLNAHDLPACDAAFIDGDHSTSAVGHDSEIARSVVRHGGVIVWHDYGNQSVEVTQVLEGLHESGWPIRAIEGTWLAFVRE